MTLLLLFPMTAAALGVPLDAGGAAPQVRQVYYQARFEPPPLAQSVPTGWQQPLAATPAKTPRAVSDFGSVPFYTPVAVSVGQWQSPLSGAPPVAKARLADWSLPYTIASVVGVAWQPPLSTAASIAKAPPGFAVVPFVATPPVVTGWQQALATAPAGAKAQPGYSFVPFDTAQTTPAAGIAGMAWFTPLWTVPTRMLTAPQGDASVPYNTAQIIVTTPGQRRPTLFIANVGRLMNH